MRILAHRLIWITLVSLFFLPNIIAQAAGPALVQQTAAAASGTASSFALSIRRTRTQVTPSLLHSILMRMRDQTPCLPWTAYWETYYQTAPREICLEIAFQISFPGFF
jgi:hypothetical protein